METDLNSLVEQILNKKSFLFGSESLVVDTSINNDYLIIGKNYFDPLGSYVPFFIFEITKPLTKEIYEEILKISVEKMNEVYYEDIGKFSEEMIVILKDLFVENITSHPKRFLYKTLLEKILLDKEFRQGGSFNV